MYNYTHDKATLTVGDTQTINLNFVRGTRSNGKTLILMSCMIITLVGIMFSLLCYKESVIKLHQNK